MHYRREEVNTNTKPVNTAREIFDGSVRVQGTINYTDGKSGEIAYLINPETGAVSASQITRFEQTNAGAIDVEFYILGDDFRFITAMVGFGDLWFSDKFGGLG